MEIKIGIDKGKIGGDHSVITVFQGNILVDIYIREEK